MRVHTQTLETFLTPASVQAWSLREVEATYVPAHAVAGAGTMRLVYPRWGEGKNQWPAAILHYGQGQFTTKDWHAYEAFRFDVYSDNPVMTLLNLRIDDEHGARATFSLYVPSRQRHTVSIPMSDLFGRIDTCAVVSINIFMCTPSMESIFYLDNLRLEADPATKADVQLIPDPLGEGKVQVRMHAIRAMGAYIEVMNSRGAVVARHEEQQQQWLWQWQGAKTVGNYRVRVTLTDPLTPEAPPEVRMLGAFQMKRATARPQLIAWYAPSTQKVMLHSRPDTDQPVITLAEMAANRKKMPPLSVEMARNEYEGGQIVFLAREKEMRVRLQFESLTHVETQAPFDLRGSAIYQVGYVKTEHPKEYPVEYVGWWPDPLLPATEMIASPGECMPAWISLRSHPGTTPGRYTGRIGVWIDGTRVGALPLAVTVHDVTLPERTTLKTAFAYNEDITKRLYGAAWTEALRIRYQDFIAAHRLNVDFIYRRTPPAIDDLERLHTAGKLNAFCIRYIDDTELQSALPALDDYIRQLRERGLARYAYLYGFDEVNSQTFPKMQETFKLLKERYPDIRIVTTAKELTYGELSGMHEVDVWTPVTAEYDLPAATRARARGAEVWWYICVVPPHPYANWFIEHPAIEARLLWWMTYQQQVSGFLYYYINLWEHQQELLRVDGRNKTNWDPRSFGTFNGDGSLICAGPDGPITTMRFENIRDGIEDYELLRLLDPGDGKALCGQLIQSLVAFSTDTREFAATRQALLRLAAQHALTATDEE